MKTLVDIDEESLAAAAAILGTTTKKDTVNAALAAVVLGQRRSEALVREFERAHLYQGAVDDEALNWG